MLLAHTLSDIEEQIASGAPVARTAAERVFTCVDLISVGVVGDAARRRVSGDRMTFGRVCDISSVALPAERGEAGEVRLGLVPDSLTEAVAIVRAARPFAGGAALTGFTPGLLLEWAATPGTLAGVAETLRAAGLDALAEVPLDGFPSTEAAIDGIRAITTAGLGCWRATIARAADTDRLPLMYRAADVQSATGALRAFAPLPRLDSREAPSTGYDDVRTVAAARVVCLNVPSIQLDWPLYGPKLAQVALTYGGNDIDGVAAVNPQPELGARRAPHEDVMRQIRAAGGAPIERDGRYQVRS